MKIRILFFVSLLIGTLNSAGLSQDKNSLNEPISDKWPSDCKKIEIVSSFDNKVQPAIFFKSTGKVNRPLVVSLHTWSNGYDQEDSLAWQCFEKNYNYIHPHFRGRNNNPEACGSPEAIRDIDDAISYAIKNANVDTSDIHIIGASGGGYATLLAYMNTKYPVKTFSAWVPISDLYKWYYECEARGIDHASDIANSTNGWEKINKGLSVGKEEAIKRSPFYMKTPTEKRMNSKLMIYAGIHDGYQGAVPITQSIFMYNKVVIDYDMHEKDALVPEKDIIELLASRTFINERKNSIGNRLIHYEKTYSDKVRLVIFEGSHEMLNEIALDHVSSKRILTIGDSNGESKEGWVEQLKRLRFNDFIYNTSVSGNTIGFNNNDQNSLNTLLNVDRYLDKACDKLNGLDEIIIMLGTNDCKAIFADSLSMVPINLDKLLKKIKDHPAYIKFKPEIYVISPPPYGNDEILKEKYHGGAARVAWLRPEFKNIARKNGAAFIDVYSKLLPVWKNISVDGVHINREGQLIIAAEINNSLSNL